MKLQHKINRRYKGKEYGKFFIDLPTPLIDELDWNKGQELSFHATTKGKLVIEPKNNAFKKLGESKT